MRCDGISWSDVVVQLWPPDASRRLRIPRGLIPHPLTVRNMRPSVGLPEGQLRDFRAVLEPTSAGLHVKEFANHYEAHVDAVHPAHGVAEHVRVDAPGALIGGSAALGAIIGASIGASGPASAVGALVGGLLGVFVASLD